MNAPPLERAGEQAGEATGWIAHVHDAMHTVSVGIGVAGVLVLVWGVVLAVGKLAHLERCRFRGDDLDTRRHDLRRHLGFYILLSLELLVAADIIETIINPNLHALLVLGLIVVIRIAISFSLSYELKHEAARTRPAGPPAQGDAP